MKNKKSQSLPYPCLLASIVITSLALPFGFSKANDEVPVYDLPSFEVTGSYIRQFDEEGSMPVTVINFEDIDGEGFMTPTEFFNDLSIAGGISIGEGEDGPNAARGDVSSINLRELGPGNTLVLLNNRRLAPHPMSQSLGGTPTLVVNINTIPDAAIQRVEVLRDGASALYGTDATAGVVNTILSRDYDGSRLTLRYGFSEDTTFREYRADFAHGVNFNNNRTNISIFGQVFDRSGMPASQRHYSASADSRHLLPEEWEGNNSFRNLSAVSPWAGFIAGGLSPDGNIFRGQRIRVGTTNVTTADGRFYIRPDGLLEGGIPSPQNPANVIADGNLNPESLRYDQGDDIWLTPQSRRYNLYGTLNHHISNNLSFFMELGHYRASSVTHRAPIPMDEGLAFMIVPKTNYWNPLGSVNSPNRIPGELTIGGTALPDEGIDLLIRRYRPVDYGPRIVEVESRSNRLVAGLRGQIDNWSWETGAVWSDSRTVDTELNRVSKTLFFRDLALDTPDAYNPFNGPFANPEEVLERSRIEVTRIGETELGLIDARASTFNLFEMAGGPVGFAAGAEYRYESYADIRDDRINGTITFDPQTMEARFPEIPPGAIPAQYQEDTSDVVGVSATENTGADRDVVSAFAEMQVPIFSRRNAIPGFHRLEMQLAVRHENYSDFGSATKPKIALSWYPIPSAFIRASYSQGFRAPNLAQLYEGQTERLGQGYEDFYRTMYLPANEVSDRDRGFSYRQTISGGNADLTPEETDTFSVGLVVSPPGIDGLTLSIDGWFIKQKDVISRFGVAEAIALDASLRDTTPDLYNPNVVRTEPTPAQITIYEAQGKRPAGEILYVYDPALNIDSRKAQGIDFAANYVIPWQRLGRFTFRFNASYYLKYEETRSDLDELLDYVEEVLIPANRDVSSIGGIVPDKIRRDGFPRYRMDGSITWRNGPWGARLAHRYMDHFYDTNAVHPDTGEFWKVSHNTRTDFHVDYRFSIGDRLTRYRLRIGVRNLFNVDPPLTSGGRGYTWRYHSNRGRYWHTALRADF